MKESSALERAVLLVAVLFSGICMGWFLSQRMQAQTYHVVTAQDREALPRSETDTPEDRRVSVGEPEVISINTASVDDLARLPGIGPTKAQAILDWRKEHGRFHDKQDLLQVKGIGRSVLERLEGYIQID